MTPNDPSNPNDDPGPFSEPDVLRRLEERLDRASDAAEQLISEAARAAAAARTRTGAGSGAGARPGPDPSAGASGEGRSAGGEAGAGDEGRPGVAGDEGRPGVAGDEGRQRGSAKPPPAGWQLPGGGGPEAGRSPEVELLANLLQGLRDLIPPDLQERLAAALRELLLALRALLDWYIERMERRRAQPAEVEDIPIL